MILARFYVAECTRYAKGNTRPGWADPAPLGQVVLRPVTRGEANREWASATPGGEFSMTINGAALPWFERHLNAEVSITIDDVDPAPGPDA